ncbi:MAG: twin-arginine translocation signal domain-containing protein, partial [Sediminibacterium sp.]|nr:twin-arginine translocation signal domain-containing protein [Sediminibacterium sp.]
MTNSRRNFIKTSALAAAGVMVAPSGIFASAQAKNLIG